MNNKEIENATFSKSFNLKHKNRRHNANSRSHSPEKSNNKHKKNKESTNSNSHANIKHKKNHRHTVKNVKEKRKAFEDGNKDSINQYMADLYSLKKAHIQRDLSHKLPHKKAISFKHNEEIKEYGVSNIKEFWKEEYG